VVSVYGAQRANNLEALEKPSPTFQRDASVPRGKSSMFGAGAKFPYHCSQAIFCGIGFKFNDFIQAIHGSTASCRPSQSGIHSDLREWSGPSCNPHGEVGRHKAQTEHMAEIIQQYGLAAHQHLAMREWNGRKSPARATSWFKTTA